MSQDTPENYVLDLNHWMASSIVVVACRCGCGGIFLHLCDANDVVSASCLLTVESLRQLNLLAHGAADKSVTIN